MICKIPFRLRPLAAVSYGALLAGSLVSAPAAMAQEGAIEEITVTAQFREENLQETPIAITAISGDMLEARNQTNISDITAQAPNVLLQVNPAGGGNAMRAYIRGVGQADQSPAVDPGVGIYIDDVYFSTVTGSVFDLMDLDRVEILRGPQGTLAGMNSMGGAVKMFSSKPNGEGGYVEATVGNYDRVDIKGAADFTLVPGELFARIAGVSRNREGYITRYDYACLHPDDPDVQSGAIPRATFGSGCEIGTMAGQSMTAVKGSLRWVATDTVEVNVTADMTDDESEVQASVLREAGEFLPGYSELYQGASYNNKFVPYGPNREDTVLNDPYATYANFTSPGVSYTPIDSAGNPGAPNGAWYAEPANHLQGWGTAATVDWDLADNLSLKSITAYRTYETLSGQDNDGSPVVLLQSLSEFEHEQFSQEFRLSGVAFDGLLDYTVGAIHYSQETVYASRQLSVFVPVGPDLERPIWDFIQDDTTSNEFNAIFAHGIWNLTDRLSLATGIRYTEQNKDYTFYRFNVDNQTPYLPLSNPDNPLNGLVGNFEGDHTDYRLNLSYQFTDDIMAYAQYSTGFKGGGISPRPYFPEQVLGFDTEELDAYEIGFKTRLLDQRMQLNGAIFYNDYLDYQATPVQCVDESGQVLPAPYDEPCGQYQNVADAVSQGFELEMQFFATDNLMLDAAYSYLDFEFQEPFIETTSVIAGASAPGIGERKWSIGAQYEFRLSGGGTIVPRIDMSYMPEFCTNMNCDAVNEDYTLTNMRVTYTSPDTEWIVALEGTNVTDELYVLNQLNTSYSSSQVGAPAQWAVSAKRNF